MSLDEFEIELKMTFLDEALALLEESEEYYMNLEETAGDVRTLDAIFRNAHSLKGSSKAAGFEQIGVLTHSLENVLLKIKEGAMYISPSLVSLLLKVNDVLRNQIESLMQDLNASFDPSEYIIELDATMGLDSTSVEKTEESSVNESGLHLFDDEPDNINDTGFHLFDEDEPTPEPPEVVEEIKSPQVMPAVVVPEVVSEAKEQIKAITHDEKIRVSINKIETLINAVGELVILQAVLTEEARRTLNLSLVKVVDQIGKIVKEVQDISMGLRMVPIKQIFKKMQRITRDSALDLGKNVNFKISGEEVEVDKTVLDRIGDPLVHITRNAVDHGIEMPEDRENSSKSAAGDIKLSAYHDSGRLIISMVDDGKGIDPKVIKSKAISKGIIRADSNISDKDVINLIFHPGFSTKEEVTSLSGRGVGMDVVKTNIEHLSGEITVTSTPGKGSEFKISLPLTLAIIDGLIVTVSKRKFVIPLSHVIESVRVDESNVKFVTGIGDVLMLRGENLPLIGLNRTLGLVDEERDDLTAIVVEIEGKSYGVLVDEILSRSQVVIKQLGSEIQHVKGFSGGTILGDGRPSLILEVSDVIDLYKPSKKPMIKMKGIAA